MSPTCVRYIHVFTECRRHGFFTVYILKVLTLCSLLQFLLVDSQKKPECTKCQVLNFLIREANLAIYQARRNRVWDRNMCDVKDMREQNIKVRLRLEFCFHNASMNLEVFHQLWGHEDILSRATEQRQLEFTSLSLLKWNEWFLYIYKTINKVLLKVRKSLKMEKFSLSLSLSLSTFAFHGDFVKVYCKM